MRFRAVMTLATNSTLQLQSGNRWSDVCDVRGREMHVQARVCVSTPRTREHNATAGGGEDDLATLISACHNDPPGKKQPANFTN